MINNKLKYEFFYETSSLFSNWYPAQYTLNGIMFNCSEQGVMYDKAILFGDENVATEIMKCNSSQQRKMKQLGRTVKNFDENIWKNNREKIYHKHCSAKFKSNQYLKNALLNTHDKILVEASPTDLIWGIGLSEEDAIVTPVKNWKGLNLLGKILTQIREEIKQDNI